MSLFKIKPNLIKEFAKKAISMSGVTEKKGDKSNVKTPIAPKVQK